MGKALPNKLLAEQAVRKIEMFNDNKTSFILIRDPVNQNYTKHFDITYTLSYARSGTKRRTRN